MEAVVCQSLLYLNFTTLTLPQGSTNWAVFRDLKSQFINQWQPHYKLMSGETLDSDETAMKIVLPHVWVFIKNNSIAKTRHCMKREKRDASGIKDAKRSSGPAIRGKLKSARLTKSLKTVATSLKVLQSSNRANNKSRSSHNASSSSRSPSSLPGNNRLVFNSIRVAAINKNSVASSRSIVCILATSSRYAVTMFDNETSWISTSSFKMRCKSNSNGPSNVGVETAYFITCEITSPRLSMSATKVDL